MLYPRVRFTVVRVSSLQTSPALAMLSVCCSIASWIVARSCSRIYMCKAYPRPNNLSSWFRPPIWMHNRWRPNSLLEGAVFVRWKLQDTAEKMKRTPALLLFFVRETPTNTEKQRSRAPLHTLTELSSSIAQTPWSASTSAPASRHHSPPASFTAATVRPTNNGPGEWLWEARKHSGSCSAGALLVRSLVHHNRRKHQKMAKKKAKKWRNK